jgi:ribosome-associated protein
MAGNTTTIRDDQDDAAGGIPLAPGVRVAPSVVTFSFASSSGPGGQNVNKKATKAELRIRLADIPIPPDARERLASLAGRRLTDAGELVIAADEYRSQGRNRDACLERLRELIVQAQVRPKRRRATRPSRGAVERRIEAKKHRSARKRARGGPGED